MPATTALRKAPPGQKWCAYCRTFHPLESFADRPSRPGGKDQYCNWGRKMYLRTWRSRKRGEVECQLVLPGWEDLI